MQVAALPMPSSVEASVADPTKYPVHARLTHWAHWARRRSKGAFTTDIEAVEKAVGHLKSGGEPRLQRVVVLVYLERWGLEEIATHMGITEYHAGELFDRAIRKLSRDIPYWSRVLDPAGYNIRRGAGR